MRQPNRRPIVRDTVLLGGWLFADLLLGLMVVFLASIPRIPPPLVKIPRLIVSPTHLDPTNSQCIGANIKPQCTVTVEDDPTTGASVTWTAVADFGTAVTFSSAQGTLSPGASMKVSISAIACQNGSFIFSGSGGAVPVIVPWRCTPPPVIPDRLERDPRQLTVTIDVNGLLSNSPRAISDIEQQVSTNPVLQGRSVGLAIVYGGAPTAADIIQAQQIAKDIYAILKTLGQQSPTFQRSSNYVPLYTLYSDQNVVKIDVYLFVLQNS